MVEIIESKDLPVNRKQGAVLSSVGFSTDDFKANIRWIGGVKFEQGEREIIENQLESMGLLVRNDDSLILTPEGEALQTAVDVSFLKED